VAVDVGYHRVILDRDSHQGIKYRLDDIVNVRWISGAQVDNRNP
jgi:hypothetical protein